MRDGLISVVITRERIERSKLHPSCAEFSPGVVVESANVITDEWNAVHLEVDDSWDGELEVIPLRESVSIPVLDILS